MPMRSVIDVEVNSQEFQHFLALYNKYQAQLEKTPGAWAKVSKEQKGMSSNFEKMASAMMAQARVSREVAGANEKQSKHLITSERLWISMARSAKAVATDILGATKSLLSWTGILTGIGGLLGGGSLFGIDRIAGNVSNQRRSAMGLGMSIGGQAAFKTYFERFVDPDAFLSRLSEMEGNPAEAWRMSTLGLMPTGNTDRDAVALLRAMRARAIATPRNQLGFLDQTTGLDQGTETWRRLHDSTQSEFESAIQQNQANAGAMNVPNALNWQNLKTSFAGNWGKVSSAFDTRLGELAPQIGALSDSFTKLALTLINSPMIEKGLTVIGGWIDKLTKYLNTPGAQKDLESFIDTFSTGVEKFVDGIKETADAIKRIADWLPHPIATTEKFFGAGHDAPSESRFMKYLEQLEQQSGFPGGLLAFQKHRESGANMTASVGGAGELGVLQIKPKTAAWLNKMHGTHLDANDPYEAGQLADWYDEWAMARYHGDVKQVLASYNAGSDVVDKAVRKYGQNWQKGIPASTRDYISGAPQINLNVTVHAPPGHSATVTASQLGAR